MITQEFLDELNNSQIGKLIRLKYFECSEETLDKIRKVWGKPNITHEFIKKSGSMLNYLPPEVVKIMEEENTFVFNTDNISEFPKNLYLDVSRLPDCLNQENMEELKNIADNLEINQLSLQGINGEVEFEDLQVKGIFLNWGDATQIDFSKLTSIENLNLFNVTLTDTKSIKELQNIKTLSITRDKTDPEIDFSGISKMSGIENLSISGQKLTDEQTIEFLNLPNLEKVNTDSGLNKNRLLDAYEVIVTNPEELRIITESNYYKSKEKLRVSYVGKAEIPADIDIKNINMELTVISPLVLNDEFCEKMNDRENLHVKIEGDSYDKYKLAEISAINREMRNILDEAPKDASDFEKLKYLYSKIGKEVEYDHSGCQGREECTDERVKITRSLKGGLLEKRLVCRGYALEFAVLANELGLNCNILSGTIENKEGEYRGSHAWNQVEIDGDWYNIDLTFDSTEMRKGSEIKYFLLKDDEFNNSVDYTRKNISKDFVKKDFVREDGSFDYDSYKQQSTEKHLPEKCDKTYDRETIKEAFETERIAVSTSQIMVRSIEQESKDIKKSDLVAVAGEIENIEKSRIQQHSIEDDFSKLFE